MQVRNVQQKSSKITQVEIKFVQNKTTKIN